VAIAGFRHKGPKTLFATGELPGIEPKLGAKIAQLLDIIAAATGPKDLAGIKGFAALTGERAGHYALPVTAGWRLTFRFTGDDADGVELRIITKAISWQPSAAPPPPA
jgi:proteic killer suppression protein